MGDTKEGTFAIRVVNGLTEPGLKMLNSEGKVGEDEIWGKRANWVDYSGEVDGESLGIAIFDNPANIKHPTYWHARDYGLFAVNPFGEHDFYKDPKRDGSVTIATGKSLTFRYRVLIHHGDAAEAHVAEAYNALRGRKVGESVVRVCSPRRNHSRSTDALDTDHCFFEVFMDRLIKARKNGKFQQIVAPGTMRFLDFATLQLEKGDRHSLQTGAREYVLDIFSGSVTLVINTVGRSKEIYSRIGKRAGRVLRTAGDELHSAQFATGNQGGLGGGLGNFLRSLQLPCPGRAAGRRPR